jgi:hypothetical protein
MYGAHHFLARDFDDYLEDQADEEFAEEFFFNPHEDEVGER